MKKRMIAMALLIVMLFALSACGSSTAAAPAAQPAQQTPTEQPAAQAPAEQSGEQPAEQGGEAPTAVATENAIPDGSGVVTITSQSQGFSIDFDSDKYVAMENLVGNIDLFAGQDEGIPNCSVQLHLKENSSDAVNYLKQIAEGVEIEMGKDLVAKAGEPKKISYGDRDIYYIVYTFKDKNAGGNVQTAYYAENLKGGDLAVYTSSALEGQTADVDAILKLAIQSFKFGA